MLRFRVEDFSAKLPWFYHGLAFDPPRDHGVHSFEVNGLELPPGPHAVTLIVAEPCDWVAVSRDGLRFERIPVQGDTAPLSTFDLSRGMLSLYSIRSRPGRRRRGRRPSSRSTRATSVRRTATRWRAGTASGRC